MRRRHPAKVLALTAADKTRDPISAFGSIASHTLPISWPRHSLAAWRRRARRATRQAARAGAARDWEGNGNFVAGHKHDLEEETRRLHRPMVGLAIGVIARMAEPKHRAVRRIEQGGAIQTLQGAPPQQALGG